MSFLSHTLANPEHTEPHSVQLDNGVRLEFLHTGILRIQPATSANRRILISCGIHGNETAPMEIVDQLFGEIKAGILHVAEELLLIIGNPSAANLALRFEHENLNRLFSGRHNNSDNPEAKRAALIEQVTRKFFTDSDLPCFHYDLHTAIRGSQIEKFAVYPYLHGREWSVAQLGFLESCGLGAVLLSNQPAGTFSYYTSHEFAAHSFTLELGKVRKFGENDLSNFTLVIEGLRRLISGSETFSQSPETIQVFEVVEEVIKRTGEFRLHVEADAKNFTEFKQGALLASDKDYEYRTRSDGERFVFPISNVPCGERAMLVIAPVTLTV